MVITAKGLSSLQILEKVWIYDGMNQYSDF